MAVHSRAHIRVSSCDTKARRQVGGGALGETIARRHADTRQGFDTPVRIRDTINRYPLED